MPGVADPERAREDTGAECPTGADERFRMAANDGKVLDNLERVLAALDEIHEEKSS